MRSQMMVQLHLAAHMRGCTHAWPHTCAAKRYPSDVAAHMRSEMVHEACGRTHAQPNDIRAFWPYTRAGRWTASDLAAHLRSQVISDVQGGPPNPPNYPPNPPNLTQPSDPPNYPPNPPNLP